MGSKRVHPEAPDPDPGSWPRGFPQLQARRLVCSETMISVRVRISPKRSTVFAADQCSVAKIQVTVSLSESVVFAADRCSVATKGTKRAQT